MTRRSHLIGGERERDQVRSCAANGGCRLTKSGTVGDVRAGDNVTKVTYDRRMTEAAQANFPA